MNPGNFRFCFMVLISVFVVHALVGCGSLSRRAGAEIESDVVLYRMDGASERPNWLKEGEVFKVENGTVVVLGTTTLQGDARVEAGYRIAENNAKAGIASAIEAKLDFVFQNAEEGAAIDATQSRFIGSEANRLVTSSIRQGKRYYEKVATSTDNGERRTIYRVFATVQMPDSDFRRAILDAVRKAQGRGGLSSDFAKKVDQHWDKISEAPTRTTASEKAD